MSTSRHLVASIVSVDYSDYLIETLPHTAKVFDVIYVVTTEEDAETREVCRGFADKVCVLLTDSLHKDAAAFNFAAMRHESQRVIHEKHPDSWVVMLDADILIPETFRESMNEIDMSNTDVMYSCPRNNYNTYEEFESGHAIEFPTSLIGCGYFQMYYDKTRYYPESSHDCSRCDETFKRSFRSMRVIPCPLSHLGRGGVNWSGRKSSAWRSSS